MSDKLFANIAAPAPEKDKPAPKPAAAPKEKVEATKETPASKPEAPVVAPEAAKPVEAPKAAPVAEPEDEAPVVVPDEVEDEEDDAPQFDALTLIRARADMMGIAYKPEHSADYIAALVDMRLAGVTTKGDKAPAATPEPIIQTGTSVGTATKSLRQHVREENMALIRIRLTNLDSKDAGVNGEIITVSNEYLGEVKRFVPYQDKFYANGYHVEKCILKQLKAKLMLSINVVKNEKGQEVIETTYVPKYAIAILPPLTEEEIERIRIHQLQTGSTAAD